MSLDGAALKQLLLSGGEVLRSVQKIALNVSKQIGHTQGRQSPTEVSEFIRPRKPRHPFGGPLTRGVAGAR